MSHANDSPWLFRRDEFDLLEEAYDAIFDAHDAQRDMERHALEEEVLEEQMQTEERMEAALSRLLGSEFVSSSGTSCTHRPLSEDPRPLREVLRGDHAQNPLYRQSLTWAHKAYKWGAAKYMQVPLRDAFRVQVNAYLVPIKISFASAEEMHDDKQGIVIADSEYELAETYLQRVCESLRAFTGAPEANAIHQEAQALLQAVLVARGRLSERKKYRGV